MWFLKSFGPNVKAQHSSSLNFAAAVINLNNCSVFKMHNNSTLMFELQTWVSIRCRQIRDPKLQMFLSNCITMMFSFSFFKSSLRIASKLTQDWKTSRLIYDLTLAKNLTLVNFLAVVRRSATLQIVPNTKTEHTPTR